MRLYRLAFFFSLTCGIAFFGCVAQPDHVPAQNAGDKGQKDTAAAAAPSKRVPVGKNIFLEIQGNQRRVRVQAEVCLREGLLEQLMTRKRTKEHEATLAADIDARELHVALTLAGAEPGTTVQFRPKLKPPTGTPLKIYLEYQSKGQEVRVPAQQWIRNIKSKKEFPSDWVFAGSVLIPDPLDKTKKPFYGANDGDIITVVNFESSCVDVPFLSTKDNDDLIYEANTTRIPALKTPVTVILEPVPDKKK